MRERGGRERTRSLETTGRRRVLISLPRNEPLLRNRAGSVRTNERGRQPKRPMCLQEPRKHADPIDEILIRDRPVAHSGHY